MRRLDHLTGLRGVAAYSVMIAHAVDMSTAYAPPLLAVAHVAMAQLAYFGMSAFFVLSGFVIHYNYASLFTVSSYPDAIREFFVARFARLYPLYALAILLSGLSVFRDSPGTALAYLTMTASWFNLHMLTYPPAWSISTEWFFYCAFALVAPALGRIARPQIWLVILLVVLPPVLIALLSRQSNYDAMLRTLFWHGDKASSDPFLWFRYFAPYLRLGEFAAGLLASATFRHWGGNVPCRQSTALILEAAAICWCVALIVLAAILGREPLGPLSSNFAYAPALVLIVLICGREQSPCGRLLRSRLMVLSGEISYSIYIWQWWAKIRMNGIAVWPHNDLHGWITVAEKSLAIGVTDTLMACVSYPLFERPMRYLIRSALMKRQARPA